jgi:hypothetical protein
LAVDLAVEGMTMVGVMEKVALLEEEDLVVEEEDLVEPAAREKAMSAAVEAVVDWEGQKKSTWRCHGKNCRSLNSPCQVHNC